jgi:predicted homoserine dehydrogenase-like protein
VIIVDRALADRETSGQPIRVALVGAGYVGRRVALQFLTAARGMRLVAIVNRTVEVAESALRWAGAPEDSIVRVGGTLGLSKAIRSGKYAVTDDLDVVCSSDDVDVVIEATGHVEYGTRACFEAMRGGKHVILMGAEVDATVGPILKTYADRAGVVYSYTDGDEPGVAMNLYRFVDSMGYRPVMMGQLKGFLDRYRNPRTQEQLAERLGQNPAVLACFADGSKLALEAAVMGNATGFVPRVRGMQGYTCEHVDDLLEMLAPEDFAEGGYVDYTLGAAPRTGAFVVCHDDHPRKREVMEYLKMGEGPLYMFYQPYHLPPWQVLHSVARAALFHDPTITPLGAPVCDTISYAKTDLPPGTVLDGMGGFAAYGLIESADTCRRENTLPIAVSLDCRLKRAVAKDQPITYDDVELPAGRLVDRLRSEQLERFV